MKKKSPRKIHSTSLYFIFNTKHSTNQPANVSQRYEYELMECTVCHVTRKIQGNGTEEHLQYKQCVFMY